MASLIHSHSARIGLSGAAVLFGLSVQNLSTSTDSDESWEMPSFRPEARIAGPLAVFVAIAAPFLGGSVEPWSQGVILALFALGFCIAPPERAPHRYATAGLLAALLLACMSFFPSGAFGEAKSRQILEGELNIPLALTISPQPWISLESVVLLAGGILWWWWLITVLEPASEDRAQVARWTAIGVIALAAVALAEQAKWFQIPLWSDFAPLGPFPNKNQMGDLLGTWAVVAVACGVSSLRKRRWACALWFVGIVVLLWALLGTASRGGLGTFIGGLVVWGLIEAAYARRLRGIAIAIAAGLCALAIFFAFGGETFQRSLRFFAAVGESGTPDFRVPIFRDALHLIHESPWCGWGLCNFEPVFALYRQFSAVPSRVLHPESDWLWLVAEMGWLAPVIAGVLLIPSLRHSFRPSREPGSSILRAAAVGGVMFLMHGLVDVSGHRLGSALPGIMLLALGATVPIQAHGSAFSRTNFRIAGVFLLAIGFAWFAENQAKLVVPGRVGVSLSHQLSADANASEKFDTAEEVTTRALAWAPLDWELYFQRAVARIYQTDIDAAQQDFRRARRLEPSDPTVPLQEGELWIYFDPNRAAEAWAEALRRTPQDRSSLYSRMITAGSQRPEMRSVLRELAQGFPELRLRYLEIASAEELATELPSWLQAPTKLARWEPAQRQQFFMLWRRIPNRQPLLAFLESNPQFLREAWRPAAESKAQQGDMKDAVTLALRALPAPALPRVQESSLEAARRDFLLDPTNVAAGYRTFRAETSQRLYREALTTLDKLAHLPQRPAYLPYLRAQILAELGEWEAAWRELQGYQG
ncbi:O-antigen ligase family protein [Verrucomicrobiota bacterium sgz303538]